MLGILADGTDVITIWAEFAATLDLANAGRGALIDLLTFRTSRVSGTCGTATAWPSPTTRATPSRPRHSHSSTSGPNVVVPSDLEHLTQQVLEHGYGEADGATLVVLCNRREADTIAGFRAGQAGGVRLHQLRDLVPYLTAEQLVGARPPGQVSGLTVSGQYGHTLIAPSSLIPAGYMACVAVGGATPVIGLRKHPTRTGLVIIPGNNSDYPLTGSYCVHGLGAGVRQRGGASVLQVTTAADYTPPTF